MSTRPPRNQRFAVHPRREVRWGLVLLLAGVLLSTRKRGRGADDHARGSDLGS